MEDDKDLGEGGQSKKGTRTVVAEEVVTERNRWKMKNRVITRNKREEMMDVRTRNERKKKNSESFS